MSASQDAAITLLYDNIASLPSSDYGPINLLPFADDTEQTRMFKRLVCEAIIGLLDGHGMLKQDAPQAVIDHAVSVKCRSCASTIVQTATDEFGVAGVDARAFIAAMASLNPDCPHAMLTAEDLRAHVEREFLAHMSTDDEGEG